MNLIFRRVEYDLSTRMNGKKSSNRFVTCLTRLRSRALRRATLAGGWTPNELFRPELASAFTLYGALAPFCGCCCCFCCCTFKLLGCSTLPLASADMAAIVVVAVVVAVAVVVVVVLGFLGRLPSFGWRARAAEWRRITFATATRANDRCFSIRNDAGAGAPPTTHPPSQGGGWVVTKKRDEYWTFWNVYFFLLSSSFDSTRPHSCFHCVRSRPSANQKSTLDAVGCFVLFFFVLVVRRRLCRRWRPLRRVQTCFYESLRSLMGLI